MQTVRSLRRALGALSAVLFAVAGPLVAVVPAAQASVGQPQQPARTTSAVTQPLYVTITGMTPTTARPTSTVTVRGTLTNRSGQALSAVALQAWTSTEAFQYPEQMTEFSGGNSPLQLQQAGEQYPVPASVPNGATVRWAVSFQAGAFYGQFGVFPVEVQATTAFTSYSATGRTFLPYWPGSTAASQPKPLQTAWVWPLVDTPQQGACQQTLSTSELAGSVASGGRLSTLLDAGSTWTRADDLTWEIDPALLSDVSVMTKPYFTNGSAVCTGRFAKQPSQAASTWLSQLKTSTAGESAFLTSYADVDAAALSHSGLDNPLLKEAYELGETVAGQILPGTFGGNSAGTSAGLASSSTAASSGQVLKAAYPADGQADAGVLTSLAAYGGINTVVLSSAELSSATPGDALARAVSGIGTGMSVLLANSTITSLLGTASASASASSQFNLTQDFLAQTAMVAAEYPASQRSLVIAPPTDWDPSPAEANALLEITDNTPWLHVTGLSALATAAASLSSEAHIPAKQVSGTEFSDPYTDKLRTVASGVSLFKDLLYRPAASQLDSLTAALAVTASSAWRGQGSVGGWRAATQLISYLNDATVDKVRLVASKKILLTGKSGRAAVSVENELDEPILVRVTVSTPTDSDLQVGAFNALLKVQARGSNTVPVPVHSSTLGTTTVQLRLATENGTPLIWTTQPLSVEVTTFGQSLLLLIFGALGILVLTSAYRLRRKRRAGAKGAGTNETAEAGGAG
jgi:hypothetical protein